MSDKNSLVPVVSATIAITQNDMVTVAVSRAETAMNESLTKAMAEVRKLEKEATDTKKKLAEAIETAGQNVRSDKAKAAVKALAEFGLKVKFRVTPCWFPAEGKIQVTTVISERNDGYGGFQVVDNIPVPAGVKHLQKQVTDLETDLGVAREEALKWRSKLSKIGTLERKYRAQLVEAQMSKSEEGRDILAAIGAKFESDILAIPA